MPQQMITTLSQMIVINTVLLAEPPPLFHICAEVENIIHHYCPEFFITLKTLKIDTRM